MSEHRGEELDAPPRLDDPLPEPTGGTIVRHQEEIAGTRGEGWRGIGFLKARTRVSRSKVELPVSRSVEAPELERVPVEEGDSQRIEILADGSISIPVFEEELVVTKRVVLKERVILRKRLETVSERVADELRRERIELEVDDHLLDRIRLPGDGDRRGSGVS